jgi:RimJ/RimL family protein N-acetyltransferase
MSAEQNLTDCKVTIFGEKIILRDLRIEDITQDYVDWMNDPEVVQFTESRFQTHTVDSICSFVGKCRRSSNDILFGIFSKNDKSHVGNIKIGPINRYHSIADIGLIIGRKSHWGMGIATEAIQLISNHAFEVLNLHKITASCYSCNQGSAKAFIKSGFLHEGSRILHAKLGIQWVDLLEYGLINKNYKSAIKY